MQNQIKGTQLTENNSSIKTFEGSWLSGIGCLFSTNGQDKLNEYGAQAIHLIKFEKWQQVERGGDYVSWSSIREFLRIPQELTGKNVGIAIVDSRFPNHPDIATNTRRNTYLVKTTEPNPDLALMVADDGPGNKGLHGPEVDLYLLETGIFNTVKEIEFKFVTALNGLSMATDGFFDRIH